MFMDLVKLIAFLALYAYMPSPCLGKSIRKTPCPRLNRAEMRHEWRKLQGEAFEELHWTFRLIPELMDSLVDTENSTEVRRIGTRTTHLYGRRTCPSMNIIVPEVGNCPMRYVMHHDKDRIPRNIVHAICVCNKCRYNSNDGSLGCSPIYTISKVLRRGSDCSYDWAYEKIPVACACESKIIKRKSTLNQERY